MVLDFVSRSYSTNNVHLRGIWALSLKSAYHMGFDSLLDSLNKKVSHKHSRLYLII